MPLGSFRVGMLCHGRWETLTSNRTTVDLGDGVEHDREELEVPLGRSCEMTTLVLLLGPLMALFISSLALFLRLILIRLLR